MTGLGRTRIEPANIANVSRKVFCASAEAKIGAISAGFLPRKVSSEAANGRAG